MRNYLFVACFPLVLYGCGSPVNVAELREQYIASHSLSPEVERGIREGRLAEGMTPEEVKLAFGTASGSNAEAFFGQSMTLQSEHSDGSSLYTLTRNDFQRNRTEVYYLRFREHKLSEWSLEYRSGVYQ